MTLPFVFHEVGAREEAVTELARIRRERIGRAELRPVARVELGPQPMQDEAVALPAALVVVLGVCQAVGRGPGHRQDIIIKLTGRAALRGFGMMMARERCRAPQREYDSQEKGEPGVALLVHIRTPKMAT